MTVFLPRARVVIHEAGFSAALLAMVGLTAMQWAYASADAPDWQGYQTLYEGSADWLSPNELAPLFIALLGGARWLFGADGYGMFRLALFALFAVFACWLAYIMPLQRRLGAASALMTGAAVLTALLLKSIVQIREGLAFFVVLCGIIALLRNSVLGTVSSGAAVAVAPLIHAGIASLFGVWLIAVMLTFLPWKMLYSQWLRSTVLSIALILGLCLGLAVISNGRIIAAYVNSFGVETSATAQTGTYKIAYWTAMGVVVCVLGRQAIGSHSKLAFAFSLILGVGLLPLIYGFCVLLVITRFDVPAVTSLGIRILFTGLDLALIMVCLRGQANWLTASATVLMLVDEVRLLVTT